MDTAVCWFADDAAMFAADCQFDGVFERLGTDVLVCRNGFLTTL